MEQQKPEKDNPQKDSMPPEALHSNERGNVQKELNTSPEHLKQSSNPSGLFKGELMEENLRKYFLSIGYFVVRGVKYKYEGNDITDVDLFLYKRTSSVTRERINVDIKNKKTPQAFERILWVNGLKQLLKFDACIVATTDQRPVIHSFGQLHKTAILDGNFLSKMRVTNTDRLTEEEFGNILFTVRSYKTFSNKDWRAVYEQSKSRLLSEQDFAGMHETLNLIKYTFEKTINVINRRPITLRFLYISIAHLLIIADYILKDIAFLNQLQKEKKLSEGLMFGNLGEQGANKIINMAAQLSNSSSSSIMRELENSSIHILRDYFSKNDVSNNAFTWAISFESMAFQRVLIMPNEMEVGLKGVVSVLLDFFSIDRRLFFDIFTTK